MSCIPHALLAAAFTLLCTSCGGGGGGDGARPGLILMTDLGTGHRVDRITSSGDVESLGLATAADVELFQDWGIAGVLPLAYVHSSDGSWTLLLEEDDAGRSDLVALRGGTRRVLTSSLSSMIGPVQFGRSWSETGSSIAFLWQQPGETFSRLWIADPGAQTLVSPFPLAQSPVELSGRARWSPTRTALAFSFRPGFTGGWRGGIAEAGVVTNLLPAGVATGRCDPHWNPDGDRVAWLVPTATGATWIYVTDVPPVGTPAVIPSAPVATVAAGASPEMLTWSPDGARLAWLSEEGSPPGVWQLFSVLADGGTKTTIGATGLFSEVLPQSYVWTDDSTRILYLRESAFGGGEVESVDVATGIGSTAAAVPIGRKSRGSLSASADGTYVAFLDAVPSGGDHSDYRLWIIDTEGPAVAFALGVDTTLAQFAWAPVGDRIAVLRHTGSGTPSCELRSVSAPLTPRLPFSYDGLGGWSSDGEWYVVCETTTIRGLRPDADAFETLHALPTGTMSRVAVR